MTAQSRSSHCPRCGAELPPDAPEGLCPVCLVAAASVPLSHASDASTMLPEVSERSLLLRPRLTPGQRFGEYRIERLLGRGGMGDVYEAENVNQSRRVALKVLGQKLNDTHDRARFLREGQLAASVTHPHSVYIFGSEEIDGVPVIAMEFLPGGTLKDRVASGGPMPPAKAVDAIRQVIAGLDAAQSAGVLHRDIKPSNCFVDADGNVKVGDFGLSISTLAREAAPLTMVGTFQGTPQFAAPEQLRGEPLDVRADIYAVGATLFYLVTGRAPFDDRHLMTLLTRIGSEPAPDPRSIAPEVPRGLAVIVLKCLSKDRAERPATYAALDDELRPFGSTARQPASMGARFVAGMIDTFMLSAVALPFGALWINGPRVHGDLLLRAQFVVNAVALLAYFGILEGRWGASIGKWICRIRVVRADGHPAGVPVALLRAAVFSVPHAIWMFPSFVFGQKWIYEQASQHPFTSWIYGMFYYVVLALLFVPARRGNGFAAVHDRVSGTRVIQHSARVELRPAVRIPACVAEEFPRSQCAFGPFYAVREIGATDAGRLLLGFDPNLRRSVWIHEQHAGAPPVDAARRDMSRAARLHWLNGHRAPGEAWDAYEALDGALIASLCDGRQPWSSVRYWLLDLAIEIEKGLRDGSLPPLTLSRVWITHDGRARLLDFALAVDGAVPDRGAGPATFGAAKQLLSDVAGRALDEQHPLPLSASTLLERLRNGSIDDPTGLVAKLTGLAERPDRVEPWRRAMHMALTVAPAVLLTVMTIITMVVLPRMMPGDTLELSVLLNEAEHMPAASKVDRDQRDALEEYLAERYRPTLVEFQAGDANPALVGVFGPHRPTIDRILAAHPSVSPEKMVADAALLQPLLTRVHDSQRDFNKAYPSVFVTQACFFLGLTGIFGVLSSLLFRGGWLLRVLGIAVVSRGREASRIRTLWRAIVAWSPVPLIFCFAPMVTFMMADFDPRAHPLQWTVAALLSLIYVSGAAYAIAHPERGWQDRLAGTWLVPR
jgi:eukaryotic-like serine/threonine-protein kinase